MNATEPAWRSEDNFLYSIMWVPGIKLACTPDISEYYIYSFLFSLEGNFQHVAIERVKLAVTSGAAPVLYSQSHQAILGKSLWTELRSLSSLGQQGIMGEGILATRHSPKGTIQVGTVDEAELGICPIQLLLLQVNG